MSMIENRPARVSKMAIASLVLGFLCCPFTILASIPAVVLGHVAHSRIRRSNGLLRGEGIAIAGFVLGYVGIVFSLSLLPIREVMRREACRQNLLQIGLTCKMYAIEHGDAFPQSLQDLYPDYISSLDTFICPSIAEASVGNAERIASWTSYEYVPSVLNVNDPATSTTVQCEERGHHHVPAGRFILYADGHVEFQHS